MADWKAVQPPTKPKSTKIAMLKYTAQLAVGLPSMYGLVQRERYYGETNQKNELPLKAFSAPFEGELELRSDETAIYEEVTGTVHLKPKKGSLGDVSLVGTFETVLQGKPQTFHIASVHLSKKIKASKHRGFEAAIILDPETPYNSIGGIRGSIPRPFWNWFEVPMDDEEVQQLHADLGKKHELAMVLTWIAGLLNVLAIWDAFEGPAYGFDGDEGLEEEEETSKEKTA